MSFPKKSRKLTLSDGSVWHWRYGSPRLWIWEPDGKRHEVLLKDFPYIYWDSSEWEASGTVSPGDIRKHIENNIMEKPLEFKGDERAVPGKLYVFRYNNMAESPELTVRELSNPSIVTRRELVRLFVTKHPLLLLDYRVNLAEKKSYCKFLIGEIICTLEFEYPRTWRGSFALYEEWSKSAEAAGSNDNV